jgi:cytochrome c-type biogenesis protein
MLSTFTLAATFVAGLASFINPCTVPLLPAYLSYASGVSAADLADPLRRSAYRGRLVAGTLLFVAGFTVVFVLAGVGAGGLGRSVKRGERGVEIVGGLAMVVFGLALAGVLRARVLQRGRRLSPPAWLQRAGIWGAMPFGAVFAVGWTPCVGPYLSAALALAATGAHAGDGAILLAVYSFGLGAPFVAAALLWASIPDLSRRATRWAIPAARVGGGLMVGLGILLISGQYSRLTSVLAEISTPR